MVYSYIVGFLDKNCNACIPLTGADITSIFNSLRFSNMTFCGKTLLLLSLPAHHFVIYFKFYFKEKSSLTLQTKS